MRILALDISTKTGWSVFETDKLQNSGVFPQVSIEDFNVNDYPNKSSKYPWNMLKAASMVVNEIQNMLNQTRPDVLVVENTVKGRNRHTQRMLEFIHHELLTMLKEYRENYNLKFVYMDPSEWRHILGMQLSKNESKNNAKLSKAKKKAKEDGVKLDRKALGIRGRITKKHLSIRKVEELFGLKFKQKDNDRADAILLGAAFVKC